MPMVYASELIQKLRNLKEKHGDYKVYILEDLYAPLDRFDIVVKEEEKWFVIKEVR